MITLKLMTTCIISCLWATSNHCSEICERTSIRKEDVVSTLQHLQLVQYYKGQYIICLNDEVLERHAKSMVKRKVRIDPKCIKWTPKDWSKRGKW